MINLIIYSSHDQYSEYIMEMPVSSSPLKAKYIW